MTKIIPPNTFTKRQAIAVCNKKAKAIIEASDKEIWTVDEINELRGLKLDGTDTSKDICNSNGHSSYGSCYSGLAEDDKVHSYDNNFGEWR